MIDGCVSFLSDRTTFISFQLKQNRYKRWSRGTKERHAQRTDSSGGGLGLGPMYELYSELDLLILVGGRFGRRVRLRATSPYASPVPEANLQRTDASVSSDAEFLRENVVRASSMNWSLSAKVRSESEKISFADDDDVCGGSIASVAGVVVQRR